MTAVLGYVRVSPDEQANGYGLEVQRERIIVDPKVWNRAQTLLAERWPAHV